MNGLSYIIDERTSMDPGAGVTVEDKEYIFIFTTSGLAVILSLSTPIRGDFLSGTSHFLSSKSVERVKNA
jgi:hypothetical protein